MKTRILCIDDDPGILDSYQSALSSHAGEWETILCSDPRQALEKAQAAEVDVVIASYRLAHHDGIDLLKQVGELLPDSQRFIVAADEDKETIEPGLGSLYQYLPKACPPDRLITEIQRCLAIDSWLGNDRIKQLVARMGEFPSLPPMYLKVVNALNARDASTEQIGQAISGDIAISAKLLQVVNSSYYGFEEKISDITQAVGILGVQAVKNLVLAIQVFGRLGRSPDQKALTDQLWHHSMSVAVAAKRIMKFETGDDKASEEAYTAGLLHDLGKLIMINAAPEDFAKAQALASERSLSSWQSENEIFGCNHAETGAYVLARWGMPAAVVEAVALHHEPRNTSGTHFSTLSAVHAANALVWERNPGAAAAPEARPDAAFLAEVGCSASWETWQNVVCGKVAEGRGAGPAPAAPKPRRESPAPATPHSSPSGSDRATNAAATDESHSHAPTGTRFTTGPVALALAACLATAAGVFLFTASSGDAPTTAFADTFEEELTPVLPTHPQAEPIATLALAEAAEDAAGDDANSQTTLKAEPLPETGSEVPSDALAAAEPIQESPSLSPASISPEPVADNPIARVEAKPTTSELPQPKLSEATAFFPDIALSGIFYNPDNPLASVNGKIRRVGDTIDGAQIVQIEKKRIIVRFEGELRDFQLR